MKKKDFDPTNGHAVIDGTCVGGPRSGYYRKKLDSASEAAGINTSLAAEARATALQAECKR